MKKIVTNIMLVWGAVFISWMLLTEGGDMSLEMLLFGLVMYLAHSITTRYILNGLFNWIDHVKQAYAEQRSQARAEAVMKTFENME